MSSSTLLSAPRQHLTERQADTVGRLVDAAVTEVEATGFERLTVRNVARRAGVAPATAYTYFSSKEHLVAEVFSRRLDGLSSPGSAGGANVVDRVGDALGDVSELVAREPELARACTAALMSSDHDVARLRARIGWHIRCRLAEALGDDGTPEVLDVLDLAFSGALVRAGTGTLAYAELGEVMRQVVAVTVR